MPDLKDYIAKVATGAALERAEAAAAVDIMMSGDATPAQIGGFLMALRVRGETVEEVTGAVEAIRARAVKVPAPAGAIDIVGTGGDGSGTYNISTAAAFVAAGAGVPVAKHGNRALSSRSGAADALAALGVNVEIGPDVIARCIETAGIGFMFAPMHHASFRHVGPARAELGTRTMFNLLGPMCNPAGVGAQVMGVFDAAWTEPLANAFANLGSSHVWVVHGLDGLDELTTTASTRVSEMKDGKVRTFEVTPEDAGLSRAEPEDLKGGDAEGNAAALREVLGGAKNAYRDIVLLNAGAGLVVAGKAGDIGQGVELAAQSIDTGKAAAALDALVATSNENP